MARTPLLDEEEKKLRRKKSVAKYNARNAEKQRLYMQVYNQLDYVKEKHREYRKSNLVSNAIRQANYRSKKAERTPKWDQELTQFVVEEAHHLRGMRDTMFSFKWDVDHVIPLRGKLVSGLHVWNNLQVIPASTNRSKNNNYDFSK